MLQISNLFHRKLQINCYHQKRSFQLKMHQKPFGGRALSGPAGRAYSAPLDPLAGLRGCTSEKVRGGEWRKEERKWDGGGREVKEM